MNRQPLHYNSSHTDHLLNPRNAALLRILPGRLDAFQVAYLLGTNERQVRKLTSLGLLKPLGNPAPNAPKLYARNYLLRLIEDEKWLDKVSKALSADTAKQNARKKFRAFPEEDGSGDRAGVSPLPEPD